MLSWELLRMATGNLRAAPLRALLTALGVIIGVAAVVAMVAIGQGADATVLARVEGLGSNLIFITPNTGADLQLSDVGMITGMVPMLQGAAPVLQSPATLVAQGQNTSAPMFGVTAPYLAIRGLHVAAGRFVNALDVTQGEKVAVLGPTVATSLFPTGSPLGQSVRIDGQAFTVVGVLSPVGYSLGVNNDNVVFVPVTTAQQLVETTQVSEIVAQVRSASLAGVATTMLQRVFAALDPTVQDPVTVSSQDALLSTVSATHHTFTVLLAGSASIALLVGGIGIMNIMLVAVTERTREIGLRKAIGAKTGSVLLQFAYEAILLAVAGGIIGVALGTVGAGWVAHLGGWHVVRSWKAALVAFGFSLLVGLAFGVYPAYRAARLDPIVALRGD